MIQTEEKKDKNNDNILNDIKTDKPPTRRTYTEKEEGNQNE